MSRLGLMRIGVLVSAVGCCIAAPQAANANDPAIDFVRSVGCQTLPMLSCELLDANVARDIRTIYRGAIANKLCSKFTVHPHEMRLLADTGVAAEPHACRGFADILETRYQPPPPQGVRVDVTPTQKTGDVSNIAQQVRRLQRTTP